MKRKAQTKTTNRKRTPRGEGDTLNVDIPDEVYAALQEEAARAGASIDAVASVLLCDATRARVSELYPHGGMTADDCMEFYYAASAYHRYMIRKESKAAGLSVLAYLRREIPALVEEGKRGNQKKNGRVAA